ncbi:MAG: hypothetical protein DRG37_08065 [Deltaproteobacteria bacterium]|nr:MAG: hypothetical protein DRG37_08065 [Deltaproteobacteria bacterium]
MLCILAQRSLICASCIILFKSFQHSGISGQFKKVGFPYTLYPVPYTLYPVPCTLYPIPCTLYPIPCTLYSLPCP